MKRQYQTPKVKKIDFSYDEQVVAQSVCNNYIQVQKEEPIPELCNDIVKDIAVRSNLYADCWVYINE